jgi:hypothetical protein
MVIAKGKTSESLAKMVKAEGIAENPNVIRLRHALCNKCLKQLSCCLIGRAKKAKPGQIIAGLFLSKAYLDGIWQAVIDCREFVHIPGRAYKAKKVKDAGFIGDLFERGQA